MIYRYLCFSYEITPELLHVMVTVIVAELKPFANLALVVAVFPLRVVILSL